MFCDKVDNVIALLSAGFCTTASTQQMIGFEVVHQGARWSFHIKQDFAETCSRKLGCISVVEAKPLCSPNSGVKGLNNTLVRSLSDMCFVCLPSCGLPTFFMLSGKLGRRRGVLT